MKLLSLQVGLPRVLGDDEACSVMDRRWETGFFKEPVKGAVQVNLTGLEGDGQADVENHGGPDKAINVYPEEHFPYWKEVLGLECKPGAFGENFTTCGLLESEVCIGDIFRIGDVRVQVSQPRQPCWKLARRWKVKDLAALVQRTGYTGWYFRVLREGSVQAPDRLGLMERLYPKWTIAAANDIIYNQKENWELAAQLASCPPLSAEWQKMLSARAEKRQNNSEDQRLIGKKAEGGS